MRINKYLARSGIASRRNSEDLIKAGKITVNGNVVYDLATTINPGKDVVKYSGQQIILPEFKYYVLNKPAGYMTTRSDPHAEKTVFELLPEDNSLITVGRLDKDTTGLLIVTNDGDFAQNIIHPTKKIEKVYVATLDLPLTKKDIRNLEAGISLDDGPAHFSYLKDLGENKVEAGIEMGRNRIVRRIFEHVGNKVVALDRIRIGSIETGVELGKYRTMTDKEVSYYA